MLIRAFFCKHRPEISTCFLMQKPNVDLVWDEIMKVKIESPPSLQPDAIDPRKSVKEHRFHVVWSVSGYQSLSTRGFQFLS